MADSKSTLLPPRVIDMTGQRFGLWTVLQYAGSSKLRATLWTCRCDCGAETTITAGSLRSGGSQSCGCRTRGKTRRPKQFHGMTSAPEYQAWVQMICRCHASTNAGYRNYGGRGITVCERWRESFESFYEDMGPRPSPGHSIDRIDNDSGYSAENCHWATQKEQSRNTRHNRNLTFQGKTQCLAAWVEELGIRLSTLRYRLDRGWTVERTLGEPVRKWTRK